MIGRRPSPPTRWAELRDASPEERAKRLPWVVSQLSEGPADRAAALELLGFWCELQQMHVDASVAQRVAELTRDDTPAVRKEACATLALLRGPPAFDASASLLSALNDDAAEVRQEAAAALGDLQVEGAAVALASALDDPHPAVRFEAAYALAAVGDGSGRDVLEAALFSPAFRAYAVEGLRKLADPTSIPALQKLAAGWTTPWPEQLAAWAALAALGDDRGQSEVERRVRRGRLEVRAYAVYLAGHGRLRALKPLLDEVADEARSKIRATAVQAVGRFEDPADDSRLERWLLDHAAASDVRLEALEALLDRGRIEVVARAAAGLEEPELRARAEAALRVARR